MSLLSRNYCGLDNSTIVSVPVDLVRPKRLEVIFLIETLIDSNKFQLIKIKLGCTALFIVDNVGHSEGLALLWKE